MEVLYVLKCTNNYYPQVDLIREECISSSRQYTLYFQDVKLHQTLQFTFFQCVDTSGIVREFILRIVLAGDIGNIERQEDAAETLKIHFIVSKIELIIKRIDLI